MTSKNNKIYFAKSKSDETSLITIPPGAYEIESLNNEIKRINIDEGHFTEANYPFTIEPNFSAVGSINEIKSDSTGTQNIFYPMIV